MYLEMDLEPDETPKEWGGNPLEERQPKKEETKCEFCSNNGSDVCKCYGEFQQ